MESGGSPCAEWRSLPACVGQSAMAGVWCCSLRVVCGAASTVVKSCKANEAQRTRPNLTWLTWSARGEGLGGVQQKGKGREGKVLCLVGYYGRVHTC